MQTPTRSGHSEPPAIVAGILGVRGSRWALWVALAKRNVPMVTGYRGNCAAAGEEARRLQG